MPLHADHRVQAPHRPAATKTSITYEYPAAEGDPYYPIPRPENPELFKKYEALADRTPEVHFVGRLATYRYYNMDQVAGQALATFRKLDATRQAKVEATQPTQRARVTTLAAGSGAISPSP